jgi:8-oxo-dGTP diphosphatase
MSLLIVRHANAGKRKLWKHDDRVRPLTAYGHQQAAELVTLFRDRPIDVIVSSPARRCMQTVAPLAAYRGLSLLVTEHLDTRADLDEARKVLTELEGMRAVLSTHREVMERILPAAKGEGAKLKGGMKWPKASTWELFVEDGRIVRGQRIPAPTVTPANVRWPEQAPSFD